MKEIHWEDIKGNDGNIYRVRIFDDSDKFTSSIHLLTVLNGQEYEDNVSIKEYPQGTIMFEILEQLKLSAMSAYFQ